jgi:ankyrin repeat protein
VVRACIERSGDPNLTPADGMAPLQYAAAEGHAAIVELLLEAGAKKDAKRRDGRTASEFATLRGHHAIAKRLA